ncbi:MAG: hypothetical protein AAF228_12675 [Pseudomonadota bacterium]
MAFDKYTRSVQRDDIKEGQSGRHAQVFDIEEYKHFFEGIQVRKIGSRLLATPYQMGLIILMTTRAQ